MIYVVVVVAAVILGVAALWALKRRPVTPEPIVDEPPSDTTPMTGLESALAQVKDRSGRTLGERIEAEHVDDLRVPDDTGPLLRRALDHVTPEQLDAAADAGGDVPAADDERS